MTNRTSRHYAHSLPGRPHEEWQCLEEHLVGTADRAEAFAQAFAPGCGRAAGLWHDTGKYQRAFQEFISKDADAHVSDRVDHSTVGALLAVERKAPLVGFAIAGHHGGLQDFADLKARLHGKKGLLGEARAGGLPRRIEDEGAPVMPGWLRSEREFSLWIRFVFSALVDADFLDTERFYAGGTERELGTYPK